jgi:E3 SUMO-protein ligase PIAS1
MKSRYVQEILKTVPRSTDQVMIEPNGVWAPVSQSDMQRPPGTISTGADNDNDDLVEISESRAISSLKNEGSNTPASHGRTPPASSSTPLNKTHSSSTSQPVTGSKRTSEVVDLTLSSDEEEAPRPIKKLAQTRPLPPSGAGVAGYPPTIPVQYPTHPAQMPRPNGVAPFRIGSGVPTGPRAHQPMPNHPRPHLPPQHPHIQPGYVPHAPKTGP